MKIIPGVRHLSTPLKRSVVTVGNFDGVHLGHRQLIRRVLERAHEVGAASVVVTFEPHPMKVLYPDRQVLRIFDFEDQKEQLQALGIDYLIVEPFSREFSELAPGRYLLEWLYRPLAPETVVVGYDFTFGANRGGTIEFLREKARNLGFNVEVVPPFKVGDVLVSSSRIRQALKEGDVKLANRLLGRSFYIEGIVEKGKGRGKTIGIPTANIRTSVETLPKSGVYCGWAVIRGSRYPSVLNIGRNPTFEIGEPPHLYIEAHLLDFSGDLYGESCKIEFVDFLRDEVKFDSATALVEQITKDIAKGKRILNESHPLG